MLSNVPVSAKAPAAASVLGESGLVHGYFRYTVGMRNSLHIFGLWLRLLLWRPQVLIYLTAARGVGVARRDRLFFQLCGIPASRQMGVPDTDELQRNALMPGGKLYESEAARLARTLAELGDAQLESPASWDLHPTEAERRRGVETLAPARDRRLVAVSLGTKRQVNDWGAASWHDLLARLGALLPGYALVLHGAADDYTLSEAAAEGWREFNSGPVLNLCGGLAPRESAVAMARASGPMHLAAAVQTPCVAIFAARQKPGIWFPHGRRNKVLYHQVDCWDCGLETCIVQQKKCITSITVDEVVGKVMEVLEENAREAVTR